MPLHFFFSSYLTRETTSASCFSAVPCTNIYNIHTLIHTHSYIANSAIHSMAKNFSLKSCTDFASVTVVERLFQTTVGLGK